MASSPTTPFFHPTGVLSFWKRLVLVFLLAGSLSACGGEDTAQRQDAIAGTEKQIADNLVATRKALTDNTLRNAVILKTYADVLLAKRPELQEVVTTLRSEASAESPRIARFQERLAEARATSSNTPQELSQALTALAEESTPAAYDASLVDSINLLADLSNGALSRLQPPAQAATTAATSTGQGTGSQFVGNPNYGQWVQNSAGDWVWNFIGAYAALGAVNQGLELLNYKDWNRNRGSGYYASGRKSTWEYRPARTTWSSSGKKSYSDLSQQRRQSSFGASSGSTRPAASAASSASTSDSSRRKSSFFSSSSGSAKSGSSMSSSSSSAGASSSSSSRRASSFSSSSGSSAKSSSYSSGFRSSSSSSRGSFSGGRFGGK